MSSKNIFNEATRVQMPALVHLNRLGYNYFGKISEEQANIVYDPETMCLKNNLQCLTQTTREMQSKF